MRPTTFYLEDVRCFPGLHEFRIRPLTFLVGENSTGKSTVLGCIQALADYSSKRFGTHAIDFNREPFQMGSFRDIARKSRPLNQTFGLGFRFEHPNGSVDYFVHLRERSDGAEPIVSTIEWRFSDGSINMLLPDTRDSAAQEVSEFVLDHIDTPESPQFYVRVGDQSFYSVMGPILTSLGMGSAFLDLLSLKAHLERQDSRNESEEKLFQFLESHNAYLQPLVTPSGLFESIAPIRAKPERTYDPLGLSTTADGSEIPMLLVNLFKYKRKGWENLRNELIAFGVDSGLFTQIDVRTMTKSAGDPFQLQFKTHGPKANLVDTGYGVSQILPVLVRVLMEKEQSKVFLMQQPEIHLHPRGQAALTSFLIGLTRVGANGKSKEQQHRFVVETHSDYMVDRARIDIQKGRIAPDDVSLIYLDPPRRTGGVTVHNIGFDHMGNIEHVPETFRRWSVGESFALMGLDPLS